jgi:hypothetical protein
MIPASLSAMQSGFDDAQKIQISKKKDSLVPSRFVNYLRVRKLGHNFLTFKHWSHRWINPIVSLVPIKKEKEAWYVYSRVATKKYFQETLK